MSDIDPATVKAYANTVAAVCIEDTLEHWDYLAEYFPDEDLRDAIDAECGAIARRLRKRGIALPKRRDEG
jgi:hypothetical protein